MQPKPAAAAAHAPGSRKDCAATSKTLYGQAEALAKRAKQIIPREFERVSSNLDDYCDEGDFEKARVSIDWMNTCLKNFTKSYKLGFCFRDKRLFLRCRFAVGRLPAVIDRRRPATAGAFQPPAEDFLARHEAAAPVAP
jgi:uncharacterized protein YsxB (DUF464 family)